MITRNAALNQMRDYIVLSLGFCLNGRKLTDINKYAHKEYPHIFNENIEIFFDTATNKLRWRNKITDTPNLNTKKSTELIPLSPPNIRDHTITSDEVKIMADSIDKLAASINAIVVAICKNNGKIIEVDGKIIEKESKQNENLVDKSKQNEIPEDDANVDTKPADADAAMKVQLAPGVVFDQDKVNREMAEQFDPSNPARALLAPGGTPIPLTPDVTIPVLFPTPSAPPPQPVHAVDVPKPKKPPVAAEDNASLEGADVNFDGITSHTPGKKLPDVINNKVEVPPQEEKEAIVNQFDNSAIMSKFQGVGLEELQRTANENRHSVKMFEFPHHGIVSVVTHNEDGSICTEKSFCIDTGCIIDPRAKLIACCPAINSADILEKGRMYELFIPNGKGKKKILDKRMINDLFFAGIMNIGKRPMYTDDYQELNTKLALITIPTKGLNKEQRHAIQDYLRKMDKDGYFDRAIQEAPGSRFAFMKDSKLNPDTLSTFTLVNEGVPKYYGTEPPMVRPVIIESIDGIITIRAAKE